MGGESWFAPRPLPWQQLWCKAPKKVLVKEEPVNIVIIEFKIFSIYTTYIPTIIKLTSKINNCLPFAKILLELTSLPVVEYIYIYTIVRICNMTQAAQLTKMSGQFLFLIWYLWSTNSKQWFYLILSYICLVDLPPSFLDVLLTRNVNYI